MHWLKLRFPVLYLASILLAGALPCASHASAHEAPASAHQDHFHHGYHAVHEAPEPPCHSGEALCGCEDPAGKLEPALTTPRDESAGVAFAADSAKLLGDFARFRIAQRSDPPERHSPSASSYDGIHGRAARLLI
jgi:hypothetical protein